MQICLQFHRKSKEKHYDQRVKWFTTKNNKKRSKIFRRSSKKMKKIRQMTPHAMCRHMVGGRVAFREMRQIRQTNKEWKERRSRRTMRAEGWWRERHRDEGRERERVRITHNPALPPRSIDMFDLALPDCCDPILSEWAGSAHCDCSHVRAHTSDFTFNYTHVRK